MLDFANRLWRHTFGKWSLDDPRPIALSAPYTFYLPPAAAVASLARDDLAQLVFRGDPPGSKWGAERMWVRVLEWDGQAGVGRLENTPFDLPQLKLGASVPFSAHHVIGIVHHSEQKAALFRTDEREWWDRCLVDSSVVEGLKKVGYLYREEPETPEGDEFPDSGWRIRSGEEDDALPLYIALGKVLNQDDSWLHLVDSPVGSAFERNPITGQFEAVD